MLVNLEKLCFHLNEAKLFSVSLDDVVNLRERHGLAGESIVQAVASPHKRAGDVIVVETLDGEPVVGATDANRALRPRGEAGVALFRPGRAVGSTDRQRRPEGAIDEDGPRQPPGRAGQLLADGGTAGAGHSPEAGEVGGGIGVVGTVRRTKASRIIVLQELRYSGGDDGRGREAVDEEAEDVVREVGPRRQSWRRH